MLYGLSRFANSGTAFHINLVLVVASLGWVEGNAIDGHIARVGLVVTRGEHDFASLKQSSTVVVCTCAIGSIGFHDIFGVGVQ